MYLYDYLLILDELWTRNIINLCLNGQNQSNSVYGKEQIILTKYRYNFNP